MGALREVALGGPAYASLLFALFAMLMQAGYEKETQSGYEKSTKICDQPAYGNWNSDDKTGEITTVVNKRFLMTAEGRHLDDIKTLRDVVTHVEIAKQKVARLRLAGEVRLELDLAQLAQRRALHRYRLVSGTGARRQLQRWDWDRAP